ncbi:MAG: L-threonylcarbamoyladenylate synthase [Candidatus Thermoplasmatota archaeon]|jgi:L-threonylcarbamoyladenylate synthase|nr:L-threonylcarbamoyladenylate synthase [Candidatus Thermoplasmatota archaeon]
MISITLADKEENEILSYFSMAKEILDQGGLIIYPTDTLYGIGASIYNEKGIEKVFRAKKRPLNLPLSAAIHAASQIYRLAMVEGEKLKYFLEDLFPSKTTVLLPKKEEISMSLTGGSNFIGVRVPDSMFTRNLLEHTGPITSTSVNLHGELLEPLSGDIEKMNEIIAHADLLIKSRGLDEKLTESKERSGSTIIKIVHNSIEIIREGEMKNTDIFSITRRWGFELA